MAVTAGTVTTASLAAGAGATCTFSFVSNGSPLYVVVPYFRSLKTLNTVTFNAVGLTRVAQSAASSGDDMAEIWRHLTPATTTANIVLTFSAAGPAGSVAAFQISGQDTVTPEGTAATNKSAAAGTGTGNLAITGAATGDLIIVGITGGSGAAVTPGSVGGGVAVEQFDLTSGGEQSEGFKVPDAVTQVSGTFSSQTWAIAAIPLKVLAATTPFIFQQNALWPHRAM